MKNGINTINVGIKNLRFILISALRNELKLIRYFLHNYFKGDSKNYGLGTA